MTIWALIPCSKTKAMVPCTAREMYWPSALFRGAWRVAEAKAQQPLIFSAKYGLVLPDQFIEPYDRTLMIPRKLPADIRAFWKDSVWRDWKFRVLTPLLAKRITPGDTVVSYLGGLYSNLIIPELRDLMGANEGDEEPGITIEEPLKGMGQGKRLAWFKQQLSSETA